jgi:hypothetical protein
MLLLLNVLSASVTVGAFYENVAFVSDKISPLICRRVGNSKNVDKNMLIKNAPGICS